MNLFFQDKQGISSGYLYHLQRLVQYARIDFSELMLIDIYTDVPDAMLMRGKGSRKKFVPNTAKLAEIRQAVNKYIDIFNPKQLIINDEAVLFAITGETFSRNQARGSVFHYRGLPAIVIDRVQNLNTTKTGYWIAQQDWEKIGRWYRGEQRHEPKFTWRVCMDGSDLDSLLRDCVSAIAIAIDIETIDDWISCVGYCILLDSGEIRTYVVPLWNPLRSDGCHWRSEEDERRAWEVIRTVNSSSCPKILQNGQYDSAYFIKYRCPIRNYFLDTQYAWWSIYCELPRRLDFIASICLDYVTFWKEETKGDKQTKIEYTEEKIQRFWRYNALDCYYTLLCGRILLALLTKYDWALRNYIDHFPINVGPALHMSCRALAYDVNRLNQHRDREKEKYEKALKKIRIMTDDPDFNPGSHDQVCQLMYDVLGAQPVKIKGKTRSSDEDHLKGVSSQHPIFKFFADSVLECREPKKMLDIYGARRLEGRTWKGLRVRGHRLRYSMGACSTVSARFNSGMFMWEGVNGQNIPEEWRDIFVADPDMWLWEADYKKSDAWFVALHSQDERMIANLARELEGYDLHIQHAAHFFRLSYDFIKKKIDEGDPKFAHKATGVRAIAKRIGHGCNYWMMANTLYFLMGHDAVVAAAVAIGISDAATLSQKTLVKICDNFIREYLTLYPRLEPWAQELLNMLRVSRVFIHPATGFARVFFGDPSDHKTMRDIASQIGQNGTAGNINRVIREIYYGESRLEEQGLRLHLQVHDSLVGQVPKEKLHLVQKVVDIMEEPVTMGDRKFSVPVDCIVGDRWEVKKMRPLKEMLQCQKPSCVVSNAAAE